MLIERKVNSHGKVELWKCEWENHPGEQARKKFIAKLADEQPLVPEGLEVHEEAAICWSYGRTLGNIAVFSPTILGSFPGKSGNDAILPCDLVHAGKYRHGADRWWCRTHQTHWGTKADHQAYEKSGEFVCANRSQPMSYVVGPLVINSTDYAEVGIWCSLPAAISTHDIPSRPPKIHVHLRKEPNGKKVVDRDFHAISFVYNANLELFANQEITRVNITPPAAYEFLYALEFNRELSCINCSHPHCRYPHLDLGDFAVKPHRKHFCGNCGRDSTWSVGKIISTPLKPLHDHVGKAKKPVRVERALNLDDYPGSDYTIWASTPAILWTAEREQEEGIHVHVHKDRQRIIDETFGDVILNGKHLDRNELVQAMIARTIK